MVDSAVVLEKTVRSQFQRVKPLREIPLKLRGWTLDVLNIVHRLGADARAMGEFTNADVFAFAGELKALHPGNDNVEAKIRQRLQVLRDMGLLEHLGRGRWRLA